MQAPRISTESKRRPGPQSRGWRGFGLACLLLVTAAATAQAASPEQWRVAGTASWQYRVEIDPRGGPDGSPCAVLQSLEAETTGFAAILKAVDAADYRGSRLRLTAVVRAEGVEGWAGLMMRVDDAESGEVVAFDNMIRRPIAGSADWRRHQVVLDLPDRPVRLTVGMVLDGRGTVWVDDFRLEVVAGDVPTTDLREDGP